MTDVPLNSEQTRRSGTWWLGSIVLIAALVGVGFLAWRNMPSLRFRGASEIPIEEYLRFKSLGRIQEVWIVRNNLYAELVPGCVVNFKPCRYVHAPVPPGMRSEAKADDQLRFGISPERFHDGR